MSKSKCIICEQVFKGGDELQAFLRSPDDPTGSWTEPAVIDEGFQIRSEKNNDSINRAHTDCLREKENV